MAKINMGRVVLGGLLAGLVVNIGEFLFNGVLFGEQMDAASKALGLEPPGGGAIAVFVVQAFVMGIVAVWLYAAIRPRFGAGPGTAVLAGLIVWFLSPAFSTVAYLVMGMFPAKLLAYGLFWTLVEIPLASVAGAWVYREE